jgi:four helix bundle protein
LRGCGIGLAPQVRRGNTACVEDFRRLLVWEKAHALAIAVRRATHRFRRADSALRLQTVRAAESIPSNIVEGCYAASRKEFARFVDISIKSAGELEYQLQLAHDHGLLLPDRWGSLTADTTEVRRMLVGLRRRLLSHSP